MNKKKGFTLTELLATIVILCVIAAIAVPSVLFVAGKIRSRMYCTKIGIIENDAKLWGQDNLDILQTLEDNETYEDITLETSKITIQRLIDEGYVKKDDLENGIVLDPRDSESLNDVEVIVYIKNKRVYVKIPSAFEVCNNESNNSNP